MQANYEVINLITGFLMLEHDIVNEGFCLRCLYTRTGLLSQILILPLGFWEHLWILPAKAFLMLERCKGECWKWRGEEGRGVFVQSRNKEGRGVFVQSKFQNTKTPRFGKRYAREAPSSSSSWPQPSETVLGFKHSTQIWTVNGHATAPNPVMSQKYFFHQKKSYLCTPTQVKIPVYRYSCVHLLAKTCIQTSHVLTVRWAVWIWKRWSFLKLFSVMWQRGR